ncbi:MAG TPA: hypothetical protein VEH50_14640 [Methylomirabilota bacterium]|nr:hypothetical protein [Methylomirabilota bacterium]
MALRLGKPLRIGAIDAGSNAIRLIVADVYSPTEWEQVETLRLQIRLGHHAFTGGSMTEHTIREAVDGFREFREHMKRGGVQLYRAVATSATRESRNGSKLVELVRRRSGLELEIIRGDEEARLVRTAVLHALRHGPYPGVILDLGGGSLELNWLRGNDIRRVASLPLGAVRLMETYGAAGPIPEHRALEIQQHVEHIITSALGRKSPRSAGYVVGCGGNAETLARIAAGAGRNGYPALSMMYLREQLWTILRLDTEHRKRWFKVRRDRAEVMGVAAIVLLSVGAWLGARKFIVPGVGVREGIVTDIAQSLFAPRGPISFENGRPGS